MAQLYVIRGRDAGKHITLVGDEATIGRDSQCTIRLMDNEVSRRHAIIRKVNERFVIEDAQSSNGTFVNGQKTPQHCLCSGDRLQIGRSVLIFTGAPTPMTLDQKHGVDIVRSLTEREPSQIVSSLPAPRDSDQKYDASQEGGSSQSQRVLSTQEWEIMYQTSRAISRTADIHQLLEILLKLIFDWIQCDRGCIMLMDRDTDMLLPACRLNRKPENDHERMIISKTILDYVVEREAGVLISDAQNDERFEAAASVVSQGIREAICVPLQGRYSTVGAIYIDTFTPNAELVVESTTRRFTDIHLKLLVAVGHQAAVAIEDSLHYQGLIEAERMAVMGKTLSRVSHHIKNILQGIRSGSYIVDTGLEQNSLDVVQRGWQMVNRNTNRISDLVMDMLTYSKERQLELVPNDLAKCIEDAVQAMSLAAAESQVRLEMDFHAMEDQSHLEIQFDPTALDRVLMNLLGNAIDAIVEKANSNSNSPPENSDLGVVRVSVAFPNQEDVAVSISDDGHGIDEQSLESIFSMFESTKGSSGTGLGLPVSQKIMREHDGEISVQSKIGEGTTFTLTWPRQCGNRSAKDSIPINRPTQLED